MDGLNFTLQDILGALAGTILFPCFIVVPGYVFGWLFDLFEFRSRSLFMRYLAALVLSMAISPILFFLVARIFSMFAALILAIVLTGTFVLIIVLRPGPEGFRDWKGNFRLFLTMSLIWLTLALFSLVNVQWDERLFISVISFDQTTRVSIVDAMTRTGIPPVNPGYYPGGPVPINVLYYFWYVLCSLVDMLGGRFVDARAALNASSVWAGVEVMSAVAFYIRLRDDHFENTGWNSIKTGLFLLLASGLDVIPIIMLMLATGRIVGSVDVWNTWIVSWISSALWVPHHIAALIAGMVAILLVHSAGGKNQQRQYVHLFFAGASLASAFGLSTWVAFVFLVFWVVWVVVLVYNKDTRVLILPMFFAGVTAVILSSPFLFGLVQGENGASGNFPITVEVRTLLQLESFVSDLPLLLRSLIMLLALPINYLLELGFLFLAGMYWFKIRDRQTILSDSFYLSETLLMVVVLLIGSFLRSTIGSNDLGWRSWLPGQFILLIWGMDVLKSLKLAVPAIASRSELNRTRIVVNVFIIAGILTSMTDVVLLRIAWPFMTGNAASENYYSARLAYDYLRDHVPADVITQNNPANYVDRPSGLYGTHQMIVSDRATYGVSIEDFDRLSSEVGILFLNDGLTDWRNADLICENYSIDILIFEDVDPVWKNLPALKAQRAPLYENDDYALFACGRYMNP